MSLHVTEFFTQVQSAYTAACRENKPVEHWYRLHGYTFRLCFAGPALVAALTPALAHLEIAPPCTTSAAGSGEDSAEAKVDLTLYIWDSLSTASPRLVAPWRIDQIDLRGEVPDYSDDRFLTTTQLDLPAMSILDREQGVGYFWIAAPEHIFVFERASPMKVLLHWWLRDLGMPMIHAAAVGTENGAVLITGKTGSGKSTTSLLCLQAGLKFIADDRCLLEATETPHAHCIYNSAKLHGAHMQQFPHLLPHIENQNFGKTLEVEAEKSLIYVHRFSPQQIAARLPIRAVLLARVADRPETTITPVSRMALLREMVSSTLVYQPGAAHAEVQAMTRLLQKVPTFQINLGSRWQEIPGVIAEMVERSQEEKHL